MAEIQETAGRHLQILMAFVTALPLPDVVAKISPNSEGGFVEWYGNSYCVGANDRH